MTTIRFAVAATWVAATVLIVYLTQDAIQSFVRDLLALALLGMRLCLGTMVLAAGVGLVAFIVRQRHEMRRQRDGAWALQTIHLVPFPVRLLNFLRGVPSPKVIFDPNLQIGHATVISDTVYTIEPAAGWDRQLTYAQEIERTRRLQALATGDGVKALPWARVGRGDLPNAATARWLTGVAHSGVEKPAQPLLPAPQPQRAWTPEDALNTNTRTRLAMGTDTATGQVIKWNMLDAPHLRFHGKSQGSGKTTAIQTVAAGAVRTGAQLIVLDRRRFKDWGAFAGCAELIDTRDPRHFAQAVLQLCDLYQERDALLGQHGAPNIAALEQPPPRVVVVISEFGALCATAQAEGVLDDVTYPLSLILREAGAAGVHVLIEDQVVDQRWVRGVSANAEPVTGYLPVNYGSSGGYYDAHKLAPYQFHFGGTIFNTWRIADALPGLLARSRGVPSSVRAGVFPAVPSGVSLEVDSPPADQETVEGTVADQGRWYDFVLEYMHAHAGLWETPPRGVRELARAMSRHDTGDEGNENAYAGLASKLARRIREERAG